MSGNPIRYPLKRRPPLGPDGEAVELLGRLSQRRRKIRTMTRQAQRAWVAQSRASAVDHSAELYTRQEHFPTPVRHNITGVNLAADAGGPLSGFPPDPLYPPDGTGAQTFAYWLDSRPGQLRGSSDGPGNQWLISLPNPSLPFAVYSQAFKPAPYHENLIGSWDVWHRFGYETDLTIPADESLFERLCEQFNYAATAIRFVGKFDYLFEMLTDYFVAGAFDPGISLPPGHSTHHVEARLKYRSGGNDEQAARAALESNFGPDLPGTPTVSAELGTGANLVQFGVTPIGGFVIVGYLYSWVWRVSGSVSFDIDLTSLMSAHRIRDGGFSLGALATPRAQSASDYPYDVTGNPRTKLRGYCQVSSNPLGRYILASGAGAPQILYFI